MNTPEHMTKDGALFQVSAIANVLLIMAKVDPDERGGSSLTLEWLGYRLDEAVSVLQKAGVNS